MRWLFLTCLLVAGAGAGAQGADYAGFVKSLRAEKISVKQEGEVDQPFFSVKGRVIRLYGEHVQVFEYRSAAAAGAQAALVSPDGRTVGTTKPLWLGTPHFYKRERLVVLYLGDNPKVLKALETRLGPPFAGG